MGQLNDAGVLFNVAECDLYTDYKQSITAENGLVPVCNKKALINTANGEVMSVVSKAYRVVSNEEIFSSFCHSLENVKGLKTDAATVHVSQMPNGARAMVDFRFPEEQVQVKGDGSKTVLSITALNSFDGSTRYITKAGGLRMKCMNGQIVGSILGAYSHGHTANLDVEAGAKRVVEMVKQFQSAKEYWGGMMQIEVSPQVARQVFLKFLRIRNDDPEKYNARLELCLGLYRTYCKEFGANAYAVYNVLTHYISNNEREYKNPTKTAIKQIDGLTKLLDSHKIFKVAA
jgi:hypothetical protein